MLRSDIYIVRLQLMSALAKAIGTLGGPTKVAAILGVTAQAVCFWRDGLRQFPADHCPIVERETRAKAAEVADPSLVVTCEELRPDVAWAVLREQAV